MERRKFLSRVAFALGLLACCFPFNSPPIALLTGIIIAQFFGNPFSSLSQKTATILLQLCVVGLGFGIDAQRALTAGRDGLLFTMLGISLTLVLGMVVGSVFGIERKISHLISCGTAICGGSAIAAISPVVQADKNQSSVALVTVFVMNALALMIFPMTGHLLGLSQHQFGIWSAIAIHDTSAVVAAASEFGNDALQIATTVKLARALWIIPVALITAMIFRSSHREIKMPWFIGLFVIAVCLNTNVPRISSFTPYIVSIAHFGLTVALFLIGAGISSNALRSVGWKPFLLGTLLWIVISISSLLAILATEK